MEHDDFERNPLASFSAKAKGTLRQRYSFEKKIGQGSFGRVVLVRLNDNSRQVRILKIVDLQDLPDDDGKMLAMARQEAALMSRLKHENIVEMFVHFEENHYLYMELEFCDCGDLSVYLTSRGKQGLEADMNQTRSWFLQLCQALKYVHELRPPVLHRDIKSKNVFLTNQFKTAKLGDFGVARQLDQTAAMASTMIGTLLYMAPELSIGKQYNTKADVWSMGVLLYEMVTVGKMPFVGNSQIQVLTSISRDNYKPLPEQIASPDIADLISRLLDKNADRRPEIGQVILHNFLVISTRPVGLNRSRLSISQPVPAPNHVNELARRKTVPIRVAHQTRPHRLRKQSNAQQPQLMYSLIPPQRMNKWAIDVVKLAMGPHDPSAFSSLMAQNPWKLFFSDATLATGNPLVVGILAKSHDCVTSLLEAGANVDVPSSNSGMTPLMYACRAGFLEMIDLLIEKKAQVNLRDHLTGRTAVHETVTAERTVNVEEVIDIIVSDYGADIDTVDNDGATPLYLAAKIGNEKAVKILLELGADSLSKNAIYGDSALHRAAEGGNVEIVSLLLDLGSVPVDVRTDRDQKTALHVAAKNGHAEVVAILLKHGADPLAIDSMGNDSKSLAYQGNYWEVCRLLSDERHAQAKSQSVTWKN